MNDSSIYILIDFVVTWLFISILQLQYLLLFLALPDLANSAHTAADGLYLGMGYNLIKGNPDGGEWAKLGQDPGLLLTRNILETEIDGNSYIKRTSYPQCTQMSSTSVFYDPESYKDYLLHYITSPGTVPANTCFISLNIY